MSIFLSLRTPFIVASLLLISACSTTPPTEYDKSTSNNESVASQSFSERQQQLSKLTQWKIIGKIAFFQEKKRQSANINWKYNGDNGTQRLNLTTFLGINVLYLESKDNQHVIKVDGKKYQGSNLDQLIYSLTGLTFPSKALTFWLKAIPYRTSDSFILNEQNQLPLNLVSDYNNSQISSNSINNTGQWQINYSRYKWVNGYNLPFTLTLKKDSLLIKIAIKKWQL